MHCDISRRNAQFSKLIFYFLLSATCFEPGGFILRETVVYTVWYVYMYRCEKPHAKRISTDDNNFEITVSPILMGFSSGHGVFTSYIPRGTAAPHLGSSAPGKQSLITAV